MFSYVQKDIWIDEFKKEKNQIPVAKFHLQHLFTIVNK